jgi:hypothetical protein
MLDMVAFGIAGFLFGLFIFTLVWTWPRRDWPYERETVRSPLFWYLAISAGLAMAIVFGAVSRVL